MMFVAVFLLDVLNFGVSSLKMPTVPKHVGTN